MDAKKICKGFLYCCIRSTYIQRSSLLFSVDLGKASWKPFDYLQPYMVEFRNLPEKKDEFLPHN